MTFESRIGRCLESTGQTRACSSSCVAGPSFWAPHLPLPVPSKSGHQAVQAVYVLACVHFACLEGNVGHCASTWGLTCGVILIKRNDEEVPSRSECMNLDLRSQARSGHIIVLSEMSLGYISPKVGRSVSEQEMSMPVHERGK